MKNVKFLVHVSGYNPGEQASFNDAEADSLVSQRLAEHAPIKVKNEPKNP